MQQLVSNSSHVVGFNQIFGFALCIALAIDVGLRRCESGQMPGGYCKCAGGCPAALILRQSAVGAMAGAP